MSFLQKNRARLIGSGLAIGALYLYSTTRASTTSHIQGTDASLFKTAGVSNIEQRYSAGGATGTHTPGAAGTPRGKGDDVITKAEVNQNDAGTKAFEERIGGQRPEPGLVEKEWNKLHYGNTTGKSS